MTTLNEDPNTISGQDVYETKASGNSDGYETFSKIDFEDGYRYGTNFTSIDYDNEDYFYFLNEEDSESEINDIHYETLWNFPTITTNNHRYTTNFSSTEYENIEQDWRHNDISTISTISETLVGRKEFERATIPTSTFSTKSETTEKIKEIEKVTMPPATFSPITDAETMPTFTFSFITEAPEGTKTFPVLKSIHSQSDKLESGDAEIKLGSKVENLEFVSELPAAKAINENINIASTLQIETTTEYFVNTDSQPSKTTEIVDVSSETLTTPETGQQVTIYLK